ncbi:hypothetical protein [Serratia marcescens]|uniref:hypothetical protein n=1 Tax=Serratia marcescens TaxID=615 RepID=UPI0032046AFC
MKLVVSSRIWRYRYALLTTAAAVTFGISVYFLFFKPQIPECRATVRVENQIKDKKLQRVLLVSVVPKGARQFTVLLNGSFFTGDTRYVVDRAITVDYQREGNHYTMQVKENNIKLLDTVKDDELNRLLPRVGKQQHMRIEQVDKYHYLFASNLSPLFVCVVSP